jgi:hypothetical protein
LIQACLWFPTITDLLINAAARAAISPRIAVVSPRIIVKPLPLSHASDQQKGTRVQVRFQDAASLVGEFSVHCAGFFDPGFAYAGAGRQDSRAVLEVRLGAPLVGSRQAARE